MERDILQATSIFIPCTIHPNTRIISSPSMDHDNKTKEKSVRNYFANDRSNSRISYLLIKHPLKKNPFRGGLNTNFMLRNELLDGFLEQKTRYQRGTYKQIFVGTFIALIIQLALWFFLVPLIVDTIPDITLLEIPFLNIEIDLFSIALWFSMLIGAIAMLLLIKPFRQKALRILSFGAVFSLISVLFLTLMMSKNLEGVLLSNWLSFLMNSYDMIIFLILVQLMLIVSILLLIRKKMTYLLLIILPFSFFLLAYIPL